MSDQYISFWQNALTEAFDIGKQTETFNNLFNQSFSEFGDVSSSLKKLSEGASVKTPEEFFNFFSVSSTDYQKHFSQYMQLFGLVSIDEYRSLIKKYDKLKKEKQSNEKNDQNQTNKVEAQNKTIKTQKEEITTQKKQLSTQKEEIATQKKQLSTQKTSLTKATKEMAELKKELAKKQGSATSKEKKPAKTTKNNDK